MHHLWALSVEHALELAFIVQRFGQQVVELGLPLLFGQKVDLYMERRAIAKASIHDISNGPQ